MDFKKILKDTLTIKFDKAFGLDIGDRSVEIIELEKVFRFSVVTYGRAELPEGVVENGRILDQNVLAEKLKKLLKEAKPQRVSTNKVIVSLPESQVFVKCFEVDSKLSAGLLAKTVEEKASVAMPININKTYWDFIEKPLIDKTKKIIIFVSVPRDIANSYVKFCNSIGLEVVSLCIESLSLARVLLKSSVKQSLVMDIGAGSTNLSFFDSDDKLNISITIPVAGNNITEAIKVKLKIEAKEAEALKMKFGLKEIESNTVRTAISSVLGDVLKETKQAIDYYETSFKQKLDDIYLVGGTSLMPGIKEFIKNNLKREVQIGTSSYSINLNSLSSQSNSFPLLANVVGLGMLGASGEFRDINILKKMPYSEVNSVNRLNLFNMGYLSKVNTVRTIINNKFVLGVMVILVGVIFAVLIQQAQNFNFFDTSSTIIKPVNIVPKVATSSLQATSSATSSAKVISTSTSATSTSFVPTPNYIFSSDEIQLGVKNNNIYQLQVRLTIEGYFKGLVGGYFGPATSQAVKDYQKAKGLVVTGILDSQTRAKLNAK